MADESTSRRFLIELDDVFLPQSRVQFGRERLGGDLVGSNLVGSN